MQIKSAGSLANSLTPTVSGVRLFYKSGVFIDVIGDTSQSVRHAHWRR